MDNYEVNSTLTLAGNAFQRQLNGRSFVVSDKETMALTNISM